MRGAILPPPIRLRGVVLSPKHEDTFTLPYNIHVYIDIHMHMCDEFQCKGQDVCYSWLERRACTVSETRTV
jgi:hypothetical protein